MEPSRRNAGPDDASLRAARLLEESWPRVAQYQNKMASILLDISRMDGVEEFRDCGALPDECLKKLRKALDIYDASAQWMLGMLRRSGLNTRCRFGCTHCCKHMPAGVSAIEMIAIYQVMTRSGLMDRFFRRCLDAEEIWSSVCHEGEIGRDDSAGADSPRELMLKSYRRFAHPCPFLERAGCLIYPYRPLACRMHFSASPPHWCDPAHFQNPYAVRFNLEPDPGVLDALDRLDDRLGLELDDVLVCGLLELTVNVMRFAPVRCI